MLNTIQEAIEAIKAGRTIIVVDDEDRENEGDFLTAAHNATPETAEFYAVYATAEDWFVRLLQPNVPKSLNWSQW